MTNKERNQMYEDWAALLRQYIKTEDTSHDDRVFALKELLKKLGNCLGYSMNSLLLLILSYDKEACKPPEVRVDGIYRVIEKVYQNDTDVCLNVGDIVRVERVGKELSSVKSLMLNPYSEEAIDIYNFKLEEV